MHKVRPSRNAESPSGRPDLLYHVPDLAGARDLMIPVSREDVNMAEQLCGVRSPEHGCSEEFVELASLIMQEKGHIQCLHRQMMLWFYSVPYLNTYDFCSLYIHDMCVGIHCENFVLCCNCRQIVINHRIRVVPHFLLEPTTLTFDGVVGNQAWARTFFESSFVIESIFSRFFWV